METLNPKAKEIRDRFLEKAAAQHGAATVAKWADDPVKVSIVNALAAAVEERSR